jgi:SAM-dependent methyltransferase
MGQKFNRIKKRNILNSIIYKITQLTWFNSRNKFIFFSNLEWVIHRLAHEAWSKEFLHSENNPSLERFLFFIQKKIKPTDIILDLGCGYGEISGKLGKICHKVVGIDKDSAKIKIAKEKYHSLNVDFICNNALVHLSELPKYYDVLICSHILEHLEDTFGFLKSFRQYFNFIYIEVPDFENSYVNLIRQRLGVSLNYTDEDHVYEYDRDEMRALISSLDMTILDFEFRNGVMRYWIKVK